MDAAWEISGGKRVLGLMIVEGQGGVDATTPSGHWLTQANHQVLERAMADSLPHRGAVERDQVAAGFLGVTTWQKVSAEFGLIWPPYQDEQPDDGDQSRPGG